MEAATLGGRHGHGDLVKEEKRADHNPKANDHDHGKGCKEEDFALKIGHGGADQENVDIIKPSSPKQKDLISCSKQAPSNITGIEMSSMERDSMASSSNQKEQDDQLESTRAEMGEVREENQRLKMYLDRIVKDYQTLQMQFNGIVQQESKKSTTTSAASELLASNNHQKETDHETELISLRLGSYSGNIINPKMDEKNKASSGVKLETSGGGGGGDHQGLALGLDCKFEPNSKSSSAANNQGPPSNPSPVSSFEEASKEEEAGETWTPPNKSLKTSRDLDDDVSQQGPVKKPRVSVRARCDTPTMNDGCQWRKYGQKIAKGNPCPRAYYRCTVAPSCPVRKQVQRCCNDMSVLISTYEGNHNHPLPISATAMASTTSAAASMLLSGSTTSSRSTDLHGLNFYLSSSSSDHNSKLKQLYIPNSPLFSSTSHPTITLDLTSSSNPLPSSSPLFSKFSPNYPPLFYSTSSSSSSTSLSFSSSESNIMSWTNNGFLSYGSSHHHQPYNSRNQNIGNLSALGGRNNNNINVYQNFMHKNNGGPQGQVLVSQQSLPEGTLAAATKAITADPSFQSALAAALSTIIGAQGNGGGGGGGGDDGDNNGVHKLKWREQFQAGTNNNNNKGCASSLLNRTTMTSSSNSQQPAGNSMLALPAASLPFLNSKSGSSSSGDRDQAN